MTEESDYITEINRLNAKIERLSLPVWMWIALIMTGVVIGVVATVSAGIVFLAAHPFVL
jgi:hypothetical protein